MTETAILPELRLFVRDVSRYCTKELLDLCGGKVEEVSIFDANRHVHCAELTPSYEMHYLYTVAGVYPDDEIQRDKVDAAVTEASNETDSVSYFHVRSVNLDKCRVLDAVTAEEWQALVEFHDGNEEDAYQEWIDSRIEYYNCNHAY